VVWNVALFSWWSQKINGLLVRLDGLVAGRPGNMKTVIVFGALARVFALGSQFVVLLAMSWLLPKYEFGNAMVVFTLYRLIAAAIGTAFGNALLHHVSRSNGDRSTEIRFLRTMSLLATGVILAILLPLLLYVEDVAMLFGKPELVPWLIHMSPLALFGALNLVSAASLDAQLRVTSSIVVTEIVPNAIRLLGFLALVVLDMPSEAVAWVIWVALALPWLMDLYRMLRSNAGFARFSRHDLSNVSAMSIYTLAAMQLQGIDMIVVGLLFSSDVAADYAIASRIASLFPFFAQLALRSFAPKAGRLLGNGDGVTLASELRAVQCWSIRSTLMTVVALVAAAPLLLKFFGDFGGSLPLLCLLALPPLYRSFYAGADRLLQLSGNAHISTGIMIIAFFIVIGVPFIFSDLIGPLVVPIAMLLSGVLLNPLIEHFSWQKLQIRIATPLIKVQAIVLILISLAIIALAPFASYVLALFLAATMLVFTPNSAAWRSK
jgi:O-antigen/teichoic acid export membrane protein